MNIIEKAIHKLLLENDKKGNDSIFYANLLLKMEIKENKDIPTAAVQIEEKVKLMYNPGFFNKISLSEVVAVLKHECGHVMYGHFNRLYDHPDFSKEKVRNFNIAADLEINEYLDDIPFFDNPETKRCVVNDLKKDFPNIKNNMTLEWYYKFLNEEMSKRGQNINTTDDHDSWVVPSNKDVTKEIIKKLLKETTESTKAMAGNVPDQVKITIDSLSKSLVDWKKLLNIFINRQIKSKIESTKKRRNRRYGLKVPGYKQDEELILTAIIDTSGSVSKEAQSQFWNEMKKIHSLGVDINVIECDAKVHKIDKFNPKKKVEFTGGGGTLYQPALDAAKKLKSDGIIVFGDGDCFDKPTNPKIPVLWCLVGQSPNPTNFGKVARLGDI